MIRGTSHEQDARFKDKAQKMLVQSKWPDKYDIKIDLTKIDFSTLQTWVENRTSQLLGSQDDIVSGTIMSLLEQSLNKQQKPNAKKIHVAMSGFLTSHTLIFISQLWDWLDQAQKSKSGIPKSMLEQIKKQQMNRKQKQKQIQSKKDKIKNYKFDVIRQHVGRQRTPSAELKRKQRKQNKRRSQQRKKKKRESRSKSRSFSRDRKRKRRRSQERSDQDQVRKKSEKVEKQQNKKKYRRSQSNSRSRSRSRNKNKNKNRFVQNRSSQQKNHIKKNKEKRKRSTSSDQKQNIKTYKKSISKSQSSEVVSSSSESQ